MNRRVLTLNVAILLGLTAPALAQHDTTGEPPGTPGSVTIHRDDYGVPHIYADTEHDGYYGLGYAQAEDQLEVMVRLYLAGRGELAAAFGSEFVEPDFAARQWMHTEESRAGFERLSPELQRNYRYYAAGVNRFIDEHRADIPDWIQPIDPIDPVILSRALLWPGYQAAAGLTDCRRGGVQLARAVVRELDVAERAASNEWILAPWRTADDAMIVLSDPHGGIDGAFVYESRIHAGRIHSAGFSLGAMLILMHTPYVSWGMTTGAPDVGDCYEIETDPANPRRYLYDGAWQEMVTRQVTIRVKDGSSVTRVFEYTRHNDVLSPVVARDGSKAYAVSTAYMHRAGDFDEEVYRINLAKNVGDVWEAMKILGMFPQNLMFGDADGGSLYVRSGLTPKRPDGFDWNRPVSGNTSETAWLGIHPLEDLVHLQSPPQGYMQNNNIPPEHMLEDSPLTRDRYPSYIYNDERVGTGTRGIRTVEVLSGAFDFTVDDAIELALDEKWVGTSVWQGALYDAVSTEPTRVANAAPVVRQVIHRILNFDGVAHKESVEALNYFFWREAIGDVLDVDQVVTMLRAVERDEALPKATRAGLLDAVDRAVDTLVTKYGTADLRMGDVFRIGRGGHSFPLSAATIVVSGFQGCGRHRYMCSVTQRAFGFTPVDSLGHRWVAGGSRLLRLVAFTEPIQSFTLHNFGQSEHPESPYYVDQARLTSQRRLKPVYFEKKDLLRHRVSSQTLEVVRPD